MVSIESKKEINQFILTLSYRNCSAICVNFGYLTVESGDNHIDQKEEDTQVLNRFSVH
jgi:hypothetical protein